MSDYKRLTKQDWHEAKFSRLSKNEPSDREILKRLWDLENNIERGTLIELPCKMGDTIFCVTENGIITRTAFSFEISSLSRYIKTTMGDILPCDAIRKYIFFTREEAEKKLKELQK